MQSHLHFNHDQLALMATMAFALILLYGSNGILKMSKLFFGMLNLSRLKSSTVNKNYIIIGDIILTDEDRMRQTHILGATGTGKTVLIEQMIYEDLKRGYGVIIIDAKGDRELYLRIKDFCKKIGRENDLKYLSSTHLKESVRWNPCRLGTASELQNKFFNSAKYENSFYAKACELALLQVFKKMENEPILTLDDMCNELNRLSNNGKDEYLKGLYFDIQNLTSGEWAPILGTDTKEGNQEEISLLDITRKNDILFVDLPTEGKAVQSSRLGALLLQEITLISGMRKRSPLVKSDKPTAVFVDEFDAFATDPFISFLNKGRSSGFMIHLVHQTLSDLRKVSPTFEGQVMGNVNNRFIFRIDISEDAEKLSKLFGTKTVTKETYQTDGGSHSGKGSARDAQEFEIHPDVIKRLKTGECIFSVKTKGILKLIRVPALKNYISKSAMPTSRNPLSQSVKKENKTHDPYAELTDLITGVTQ